MSYKDTTQFRVGHTYFYLKMQFDNMTEELWALAESARFDITKPDGSVVEVAAVKDAINNQIYYKYVSGDFDLVEGDYTAVGVLLFGSSVDDVAKSEYLLEFQVIPEARRIKN
jgi:hypothetical protein